MTYRWLLFDADGTLFDYDRAESAALQRTSLEMLGAFRPAYAGIYRQINERLWLAFEKGEIARDVLHLRRFELFAQAIGARIDTGRFGQRYLHNLGLQADLIQGAKETIRALHRRFELLLISNGFARVQRSRLALSGMGDCFAEVIISDEVGASKPDRRIFDTAFERLGWPPKPEVLIIGDSLTSDIRGGTDYGIDTCWYNPKHEPLDSDIRVTHQIESIGQVLSIVDGAA